MLIWKRFWCLRKYLCSKFGWADKKVGLSWSRVTYTEYLLLKKTSIIKILKKQITFHKILFTKTSYKLKRMMNTSKDFTNKLTSFKCL